MPSEKALEAIEQEILGEKAAALSRVTSKMEASLTALRETERELASAPSPSRELLERRRRLLEDAAELVWFFVVQREAMGLRNDESTYRLYEIPAEVLRCMGPRRTQKAP